MSRLAGVAQVVAWTGHRPDLFRDPLAARAAVDAAARELIETGAEQFLVGGQRGVDTWAALSAIAHAIPLRIVLPFLLDEFARDWSPDDRQVLEETARLASEVRIAGSFTERNRQLATRAGLLVAVWTRTRGGGTAETIELAHTAGTPIREVVLDASDSARAASGRGI